MATPTTSVVSPAAATPVAPEVFVASKMCFLIRMNGNDFGIVANEKTAIEVIDKLSQAEVKRLTTVSTRVLRENLNDGKKVKVLVQSLGYLYNGSVYPATTIECFSVPIVVFDPATAAPVASQ